MNIKIDENSAAAQGGQSDRLVINSFRVSPRRRCDEKGGERGLSVAPSPPPLFFSTLFSRYRREICMSGGNLQRERREEIGRVTRESERFRNVAATHSLPQ